jgi:hypothetical protein
MQHKPVCSTQQLQGILTFEDALRCSGKSDAYDPNQWIYVPDFYTEYRYILGTRGTLPLICIGINPSTAEPDHLDNTLKSVERIARGNGFDSFLMFNVYPQRATTPDDMDRERNNFLHRENMSAFRYALSLTPSGSRPSVWAAWGTIIEKRSWLADCVCDMIELGREFDARWFCAGPCSRKGHPHHPLYLRKDEKIVDFDIVSYLKTSLKE